MRKWLWMAKGKADDPEAQPDPEAEARAKAERLEREKEDLLRDIAASTTNDLRAKIGYVLNHYPAARDSDVALAHLVWETFYPEYIEDGQVLLEDMYRLPRQGTMSRTRTKIQNEYGLFQPSAEIAGFRNGLREDKEKEIVADKPGPPVLSVHADESGKNQRFMVVGSVWVVDVGREWRAVEALRQWERDAGITGEFKFADLTKDKLPLAIDFVKKAMEHSELLGFKACVLDTQKVKRMAKEEVLYGLYYELAMSGMDHEITAGRVVLPRWLYLVKDADDGTDVLRLPELQRRLTERCREYFKDQVQVDSIITATSDSSLLLQLADLFSGSVGRMYNKVGEAMNQKDEFANFFQKLAGFEFIGDAESDGESVYLRRLI